MSTCAWTDTYKLAELLQEHGDFSMEEINTFPPSFLNQLGDTLIHNIRNAKEFRNGHLDGFYVSETFSFDTQSYPDQCLENEEAVLQRVEQAILNWDATVDSIQ